MYDRPTAVYYRARAAEYEQIYYRDDVGRQNELAVLAEDLRELSAKKDVLDLACGTGYWTAVMASESAYLLASDISAEMLDLALTKSYSKTVEFVRADLLHPPFRTKSFDLLTLGFWFSHQPRQYYDQFFNTIASLVRTGGLIWMVDNNPPAEGGRRMPSATDRHGNTFKHRWLEGGSEHEILKNYFSKDQLERIFGERFRLHRLSFNRFYWSAVLSLP